MIRRQSFLQETRKKQKKEKEKEQCSWSEEYKIIIHRFDVSSAVCRCGKTRIKNNEEPKDRWGHKYPKSSKNSNK